MTTSPGGGLRAALDELEGVVTAREPLAELRRFTPFHDLDLLFQIELGAVLRTGPGAAVSPARLLKLAQEAAGEGLVALKTPVELRRALERTERRIREAGAWAPDEPSWWSPLPAPTPAETLRTERRQEALPADLAAGWKVLPAFVPEDLVRTIHGQLEAACEDLGLEREGVGTSGGLSARRSDAVRYVTGRERELLARVPGLAAFVQWALEELAEPFPRLFPPRHAMLARYPGPSTGYAPHLDNPGGANDNGRSLTVLAYLNAPGEECAGGELALWQAGERTTSPPSEVVRPLGGSAVVFDARAVPHQVLPLGKGPARWSLALWLSDVPQGPIRLRPKLGLGLTEALLPIAEPALPQGTVLFHELDESDSRGKISARRVGTERPRVGLVATVYRGGRHLDAWCAHHFALGFDHTVLVFDHLDDEDEAADAARLRAVWPEDRLTIWPGQAMGERWAALSADARSGLLRFARSGSSSYAVSARQALNASVALIAARGEELGGEPLDWLLHLDADELFHLEGRGRGGAALRQHFATASRAGWKLLRYVNHELLVPPRYKVNPRLAAARLGPAGWAALVRHLAMGQDEARPYFHGYHNGKSAVAVAAGRAAAGVHGWFLRRPLEGGNPRQADPAVTAFLAGPSVLHRHFGSPEAFARKYLAIAGSPPPPGPLPFEPSPAEVAALALIRTLRQEGAGEEAVRSRLGELYRRMTTFAEDEVELLEEAGAVFRVSPSSYR